MKRIINTYLALLIITVVGSGLTMKVVDVGATSVVASAMIDSQSRLAALYATVPKHHL